MICLDDAERVPAWRVQLVDQHRLPAVAVVAGGPVVGEAPIARRAEPQPARRRSPRRLQFCRSSVLPFVLLNTSPRAVARPPGQGRALARAAGPCPCGGGRGAAALPASVPPLFSAISRGSAASRRPSSLLREPRPQPCAHEADRGVDHSQGHRRRPGAWRGSPAARSTRRGRSGGRRRPRHRGTAGPARAPAASAHPTASVGGRAAPPRAASPSPSAFAAEHARISSRGAMRHAGRGGSGSRSSTSWRISSATLRRHFTAPFPAAGSRRSPGAPPAPRR